MLKFLSRFLISLYKYSAVFWIVSLLLYIFYPTPDIAFFFYQVAVPTTLTMVAVAMFHWAIVYRDFIKNHGIGK